MGVSPSLGNWRFVVEQRGFINHSIRLFPCMTMHNSGNSVQLGPVTERVETPLHRIALTSREITGERLGAICEQVEDRGKFVARRMSIINY